MYCGQRVLPSGAYGDWVRPVSERAGEELSWAECRYKNGQLPKLLDVIDVPLRGVALPSSHQVENHLFDAGRRCVRVGRITMAELPNLRDEPETLWIDNGHTFGGEKLYER